MSAARWGSPVVLEPRGPFGSSGLHDPRDPPIAALLEPLLGNTMKRSIFTDELGVDVDILDRLVAA